MDGFVYMLKCSDASYYVGSHRGTDPGNRVAQHQAGEGGDYTSRRRPVELVWSETFIWFSDAAAVERQIKGWSRAKKQALIGNDWASIKALAKRRGGKARPPKPDPQAPQDEEEL